MSNPAPHAEHAPEVPTEVPSEAMWTRGFTLLLSASLLYFMGVYLLLPTLPLYAVHLGGGDAAAGLLMGFFTGAAVAVRPLTGWALDAYGRKTILLVGAGLSAVVIVAHQWAGGIVLLLLLRFVNGMGFGLQTTAAYTVAGDMAPRTRVAEATGFFTLALGVPMAVSPSVGMWLMGRGDYTALFLLAGLITALSLSLCFFIPFPHRARSAAPAARPSLTSLLERSSLFPAAMIFVLTLTYGPILSLISLYGVDRGLGNVGIFFTVFAVVLTVTRPIGGRLADRWGYEPTAVVGLVFVGAGLLTLAAAHSIPVLLAAGGLYGMGFGTTQPSLQAIVIHRVVPARRGAAMATFLIAYDLGLAIGSVVAGFLAGILTLGGVFGFSAALAVVAIVLLLLHMRREVPAFAG